jgi:hypothetical protein
LTAACIASRWIVLRRFILMCSETESACLPAHATGSLDRSTLRPVASMREARSYLAEITKNYQSAVRKLRKVIVIVVASFRKVKRLKNPH